MRAAVLALAVTMASSGLGLTAARAAPDTALSEIAEPQCLPAGLLIAASQRLGVVLLVRGERFAEIVDQVWRQSGRGEAPAFDAAVVLLFVGRPLVGIAPIVNGEACVNLIVPKALWDSALKPGTRL